MRRSVTPEWLDSLPAEDPLAQESRQDLKRLNTFMGNARQMSKALQKAVSANGPVRLTELGAGDGAFAVRVANNLPDTWRGTNLLLLDLQATVPGDTHKQFRKIAWHLDTMQSDVFQWLERPG